MARLTPRVASKTSKVPGGLSKVMVTVLRRLALGGGGASTLPAEILPVPVLATAAALRMGAAAAMLRASVTATPRSWAPVRVGWIRMLSLALAAQVPAPMVMPSTVIAGAREATLATTVSSERRSSV